MVASEKGGRLAIKRHNVKKNRKKGNFIIVEGARADNLMSDVDDEKQTGEEEEEAEAEEEGEVEQEDEMEPESVQDHRVSAIEFSCDTCTARLATNCYCDVDSTA